MLKKTLLSAAVMALSGNSAHAGEVSHPVVLELFTSQGCSSCPPADALLQALAAGDPKLVPLSFHVDYWDYLSWKDPFSSPDNTARQRGYSQALHADSVFTPQLIVNGATSLVGSDRSGVIEAIAKAKSQQSRVNVSIHAAPGGQLVADIAAEAGANLPESAELVLVSFIRHATTRVAAGENGGRTLESINNVTGIRSLGRWSPARGATSVALPGSDAEGVAVLVQTPGLGVILGADVHYNAGTV